MESENHSTFLSAGSLQKVDSFLIKKYIIPLDKKDFVLYCFTKILNDFSSDSTVIVNNSLNELMTLRSGSNYVLFGRGKSIADSAIFLSDLPDYGTPLNKLLQLKENINDKYNTGFLNQILYTTYSFFDQIDTIRQLLYEEHTSIGNSIANRASQLIKMDNQLAIPKILGEADNQKVIMINESHYDWRQRYFATLLLDSSYKKGFKYLCMETLSNEVDINKRKYPTYDDGFYLKEPFMANLVRTALKIGYTLVAYEDTTKQDSSNQYLFHSPVDKREYNQALNLYNHFKKDGTAKWIVYAGYSHINKFNFSAKEPSTMAKYFAKFSHVNPYSINQSMYSDLFSSKVPIPTIAGKEDFFYLRNDQVDDANLLKQSDLFIINNIHTIPYEIPDSTNGYKEYRIRYNKERDIDVKYFIEVFLKDEYFQQAHSIPIYIKWIEGGVFDKSIWLPGNNYYLVVRDLNDKVIFEKNL